MLFGNNAESKPSKTASILCKIHEIVYTVRMRCGYNYVNYRIWINNDQTSKRTPWKFTEKEVGHFGKTDEFTWQMLSTWNDYMYYVSQEQSYVLLLKSWISREKQDKQIDLIPGRTYFLFPGWELISTAIGTVARTWINYLLSPDISMCIYDYLKNTINKK